MSYIWLLNVSVSSLDYMQQFRPERIYFLPPKPERLWYWLWTRSGAFYPSFPTPFIVPSLHRSCGLSTIHFIKSADDTSSNNLRYMYTESEFFTRKPAVLKSCLPPIVAFAVWWRGSSWPRRDPYPGRFLLRPQFHHTSRLGSSPQVKLDQYQRGAFYAIPEVVGLEIKIALRGIGNISLELLYRFTSLHRLEFKLKLPETCLLHPRALRRLGNLVTTCWIQPKSVPLLRQPASSSVRNSRRLETASASGFPSWDSQFNNTSITRVLDDINLASLETLASVITELGRYWKATRNKRDLVINKFRIIKLRQWFPASHFSQECCDLREISLSFVPIR